MENKPEEEQKKTAPVNVPKKSTNDFLRELHEANAKLQAQEDSCNKIYKDIC